MAMRPKTDPLPASSRKPDAAGNDRDTRLAEALRQNLRRRKSQKAARDSEAAGSSDPELERS